MNNRANRLVTILLFAVFMVCFSQCTNSKTEPAPTTPIFAGTTTLSLVWPSHGATSVSTSTALQYSVPSEVSYVVIGIFNADIVTNGSTISNEGNFLYGSRTGMSDFVRGNQSQSALHAYDAATKNFKSPNSSPAASSGTYYWAVWGYDQYGNLTHSSPSWKFTM